MPRIEIELTSSRPDGTWTWRAAGARQPKGSLDGSLLPPDAKVGDVMRAESEMGIDGTTVTAVLASKAKRSAPDRLTLLGSGSQEGGVTGDGVAAARRGEEVRSGRRQRRDRPEGRDGSRSRRPGGREGGERERQPRSGGRGDEATRGDRPRRPASARTGDGGQEGATPPRRRERPPRPERPSRPRPRRLQPGRAHRDAALEALPPEQRPVAEQVLRGGMQAVRKALAEQNSKAREAGEPEVRADALIAMAEGLVPQLRAADWRDRAEAAASDMDSIGLRDLRAVVAAADSAGRDDKSRELLSQLRNGLELRTAAERESWIEEIRQCMSDGRLVRALRVSARPPDPTAKVPPELASEMSEATGNALSPDAATERWLAVLEAAMSSPVRAVVRPKGLPRAPTSQLHKAVMLASPRMPGLREVVGPSPARPQPPPPPPPPPPPSRASGDDGDDAVLVEELG